MDGMAKGLIMGLVIVLLTVGTYYIFDKDELQQEAVIEISQESEQDIVKNRLTHDEMQNIDDEMKEKARAIN